MKSFAVQMMLPVWICREWGDDVLVLF